MTGNRLPSSGAAISASNPAPNLRPSAGDNRADLGRISNRIDELIDVVSTRPDETLDANAASQKISDFNQQFQHFQSDAPVCDNCGSITVRNANCYRCFNCGSSMGCS